MQTLEDRTLLSGGTVFPFIDGDYTIDGLTANIDQDGDFLTLTNEFSSVSSGDFLSETQIIANDWEGGLVGDLHDGWIAWANGTVWFDIDATPDSTDYSINGGVANTLRDGNDLAFTNELGEVSQGYYLSGTQVIASDWESGLVGDLVEDRIEWQNGTMWIWTIISGPGLGAPQFDPDSFVFVADEDAAIGTVLGTLTATDPQGQALSFSLTDPGGGSVPFAVDSAGAITVDAALDYGLQNFYALEATATDTESNTSVAASVEIYVNESTIPQASSTARTTLHDMSLTDTIVYDAGDEDADPLTFVIDTLPANGTLYDATYSPLSFGQTFDGNFIFEPPFSFVGADGFNWHASDGDNDSNVATLSIDVYNTQPQAWDGWYGLTVNTETSGDLNGYVYDEDATLWPDVLPFTVQTLPAHGTLTEYGGSPLSAGQSFDGLWQYFPDLGFVGDDGFEFFASDSIEDGDIATIHLNVAPDYNAGPLTANDDVTFTERGTPVNIAVLNNDGSMEGMLSITDVTQGTHGTVWTDTVEIAYTPTDPEFYGHDSFQYEVEDGTGASLWATVDVYVYWIDLDVDDNGSLLDAVDGTDNYLPGYVGESDVLSYGTEFADWQYVGQQMRVIVEGVGSDAGVQQVVFQLSGVTNYDGYSENTSDAAIEGSDKDKDFAFTAGENQSLFVATGANIEPTRSWAPLWAKDYGADANIQVSFQVGTAAAANVVKPFKDDDGDKLPDKWEEAMVTEWNSQYGTTETVSNAFFAPGDDKELKDPDGATNTDGGRDLPAQKTAGDGLSVAQEFRGFYVDGGTFIGAGPPAPAGVRKLSPSRKELLVEVDNMVFKTATTPGIINNPTGGIDGVLQTAANGFADPAKGAGIYMYWVRDQKALKHKTFGKAADLGTELIATRQRPKLKPSFVHLYFGADVADEVLKAWKTGAFTFDQPASPPLLPKDVLGSNIFLDRLKAWSVGSPVPLDFTKLVSVTIAHELTHLLLKHPDTTPGQTDWDTHEHIIYKGNTSYLPYLMLARNSLANKSAITFSDIAIKELYVKEKDGTNP